MVSSENPTIFHITHWKAGSQWIRKILLDCVPDLMVEPKVYVAHFLSSPLQQGKVYPTVYVTREQFEYVRLPSNSRRFIIIRDLRDTLISAYFSIKVSHGANASEITLWRDRLNSLGIEEGLIYLMDEWLPGCAKIQESWLSSQDRLIHYEDLLTSDLEILERVLLDECGLPVSRETLREAVESNRFSAITGRVPGEEKIEAHERKGIQGDWRNYFSRQVKDAFKHRYGELILKTGYEHDSDW